MRTLLLVLTLCSGAALAQAPATGESDLPEPPELAPDHELEPVVTIRRRGDNVVEEYRLNGHLYMVKITPRNGVPYYLIDYNGDGSLDRWRNDLDPPPTPQWPLLRW